MAGSCSAGTVAVDGDELTSGPLGGVPDATAESSTRPWSRSAWVTAYVAVQMVDSPGSRVVLGHVGPVVNEPAGGAWVSSTVTSVSVTLPMLVTRYS